MSAFDGRVHPEPCSPYQNDLETSRFTYRDLRNLARASTSTPIRVIALIDFDAFYAQCETVRLGLPRDQPLAVQQWKAIIALNYPAKAVGLRRGMSIEAARAKFPELVLQHVATWREGSSSWAYRADVNDHLKTDKAALDPYRLQSRKAFNLIKSKLPPSPVQRVEKASIDEVFCDLSVQVYNMMLERYPELRDWSEEAYGEDSKLPLPPTSLLDWGKSKLVEADGLSQEVVQPDWDDIALKLGSEIVHSLREEIYNQLQYTCSAGIARNKPLAKLAAGHNKPNQQTVVRARSIHQFLSSYEFTKIRGLGGKLGQQIVTAFHTRQVSDLLRVSQKDLSSKIGAESARWTYNVIRGNEYSEVVERTALQSMLTAKTFVPRLTGLEQAEKWLRIFAGDLMGRLHEEDAVSANRRPRVIAFHHHIDGRFGPTRSKQIAIPSSAEITAHLLYTLARELLVQLCEEGPAWPCLGLSMSVSDFELLETGNRQLTTYFTPDTTKPNSSCRSVLGHQSSFTQTNNHNASSTSKRKRDLVDFGGFRSLSAPSNQSPSLPTGPVLRESTELISRSTLSTQKTDKMSESEIGLYRCPNCNEQIMPGDVLEHLDWHVAMELQQADT